MHTVKIAGPASREEGTEKRRSEKGDQTAMKGGSFSENIVTKQNGPSSAGGGGYLDWGRSRPQHKGGTHDGKTSKKGGESGGRETFLQRTARGQKKFDGGGK